MQRLASALALPRLSVLITRPPHSGNRTERTAWEIGGGHCEGGQKCAQLCAQFWHQGRGV
ncbi:unnamed protein product [Amoebophrya sp. A25]|nr:unnamed protein product [Amoebophrya sp. A25]|eukprot:GSA25T00027844001.1